MATWDDVRRLALSLPETAERPSYGGAPAWTVRGRAFVWERPLHKKELDEAPAPLTGPVLGVHVADEGVKQALLADRPQVFFTTSHFDGYPAVLVRLEMAGEDELREVLTEAWLARAPKRLAAAYLAT